MHGVAMVVLVVIPLGASLGVEKFFFTLAGNFFGHRSYVPLGDEEDGWLASVRGKILCNKALFLSSREGSATMPLLLGL